MKRTLALLCAAALLTTLAGCNRKTSLTGEPSETFSQNASENSSPPAEIIEDIELQKISDLRGDLDRQIEAIRNADYKNLHALDNFTVTLPETDVLFELELTHPEFTWHDYYDKFDRIFDRDFGNIYSPEDKERVYLAAADEDERSSDTYAKIPLAERADKFESGELQFSWLYVRTNKAYLEMYPFGNGIFRLYRDGMIKRANPNEEPTEVLFTDPNHYFKIVKDSLDVDSDEKYELLDKEMSVKEAAEEVKRLVVEHEYSWGGALEPEAYEYRVYDLNDGKFGLEFMLAPSYKGVMLDVNDVYSSSNIYGIPGGDRENHNYDRSPAQAFMMESGQIERFMIGESAYDVTELAEHDSVIPLDKAVEIASEKFGEGMKLSLGRAELIYSPMYFKNGYTEEGYLHWGSNPVWKLKCANSVDAWKYIVYINAVTGEFEFYVTDGWVV
ncbi:MAG: hypothetical protein K2J77_09540 [Oscillospiraceae bacterium]|nr:hypothetical protein [Oscillospiraceae bacterium]